LHNWLSNGFEAQSLQASLKLVSPILEEIYGTEVSPNLILTITDSVIDEVRALQQSPLDSLYPMLYLDVLRVKVKDQ
jgi:transposase-like protein